MLQAHQWCPGVAISSEGEWGLKRHGLCPMCAIYRGAVTAWSALGRLAARGIGAALPAELWLFLESCVWLKAGIGLSPVWFLPSRWVNVILECSGENRVSVLCVGLTDFWKDGFNKKNPNNACWKKWNWKFTCKSCWVIENSEKSLKTDRECGLVMQSFSA